MQFANKPKTKHIKIVIAGWKPTKAVPSTLAIIMLLSAIIMPFYVNLPYAYYVLLRWVVFAIGLYFLWISYYFSQYGWLWVMGLLALLYNPFFPVYLIRELWITIDVFAILVFLLYSKAMKIIK